MPAFAAFPLASVTYAFEQSDGFARLIVAILVMLSIYAWTTMVDKGLTISRARRSSRSFRAALDRAASLLTCIVDAERHRGPLARVFEEGLADVRGVLQSDPATFRDCCTRGSLPRPLTASEIDKVRSALERAVASEILALEARLGPLATTVTVSPFLGLLGTVWGVMMAFCGMAQKGRPDISAIAPGVSGALLTTVVGLLVAIPSVVGYNLITNAIRQTTVEMDNLVEDFVAFLKLDAD